VAKKSSIAKKSKPSSRLPVEVAVEEEAAWQRRLTITVPAENVTQTRLRERKKVGKTARLKGFRKGHVPSDVIEQRFGPLIDQRTVNTLIEKAYVEALRSEELNAIGDPRIHDVHYQVGEPLTFRAEIEIMPEVHLSRLGGFKIRRPEVVVRDEEVEELVGRLREERAILEPVDRAPREGDVVSVRIGDPGAEQLEDRPYRFELGAGMAIPSIETAILTLEPGEAKEFDVDYPEDFEDEELAGSSRRLLVELQEVKAKRLPELDDSFAGEVGDFDSLESLRAAIREDVLQHHEREADAAVRDQILASVIEANPFEVPPALIEGYLAQIMQAPEDADPERLEEARKALTPAAEREIKRQLILEKVISEQGFEVSDADVESRLQEMGENRGMLASQVRRELARQKRLDSLRHQLAVDKAFEFLEAQSTVE
jgi:trigger factor